MKHLPTSVTHPSLPGADPLVIRCENCQRPMRRVRVKLAERPHTISWGKDGKCALCVKREREQAIKDELDTDQAQRRLNHTIQGLESFMAGRRNRLNRQEKHHARSA